MKCPAREAITICSAMPYQISNIGAQITARTGIPVEDYMLSYGRKVVQESNVAGLPPKAMLQMTFKLKGGVWGKRRREIPIP